MPNYSPSLFLGTRNLPLPIGEWKSNTDIISPGTTVYPVCAVCDTAIKRIYNRKTKIYEFRCPNVH